jgi:O-antigen/teichoic acid export membrane protein
MRVLTTTEFGFYAVSLSIILLAAGAANAIVVSQLVVNLPDHAGRDRAVYAADMHFIIWVLALAPLFLIGAVYLSGFYERDIISSSWPTYSAAIAYVLREFFTRFFFSEERPAIALGMSVICFASVAALLLRWGGKGALDLHAVLWIIAASHAAAALAGAFLSRLPLLDVSWRRSWEAFSDCRINAGWALLGVTVAWTQSQAYIYALIFIAGAQAAGVAAGARILVSPLYNLVVGLAQTAVPKMVAARSVGRPSVLGIAARYTQILTWVGLAYGPMVLIPLFMLSQLVLPSAYTEDWLVVTTWWLVSLAQARRFGASTAMIALKRFRALTLVGAVAAVATVSAALGFGLLAGISGSIAALALGELILGALAHRNLRKP